MPTEVAIADEVTANIARAEGISFRPAHPARGDLRRRARRALPVAIGGLAILGSFTVLRLLTLATTVSVYSVNITTILGLGLGIDYGLFIVTGSARNCGARPPSNSRGPDRGHRGPDRPRLWRHRRPGLSSLMLFQPVFLRSMGFGGVATVAVDVIAALTVLPALLAVLGSASTPWPSGRASARRRAATDAEGGWYRLARRVMRRPVAFAVVIVVVLLSFGAPFLRVSWGGTNARVLPAGNRQAGAAGADHRVPRQLDNPDRGRRHGRRQPGRADGLHQQDRRGPWRHRRPGHRGARHGGPARRRLPAAAGLAAGAPDRDRDPRARAAAARRRPGRRRAAMLVDELSSLGGTLPWMGLLTAAATFVLLFLAFGSVVLPVKAIVMNVLSLSATFGVMVWVFQWGHLSGPAGLHRHRHDRPHDADPAAGDRVRPVHGLRGVPVPGSASATTRPATTRPRSRRPAAHRRAYHQPGVLLIIVVGLFSASGISFIKLLGVGMIVALLVDATWFGSCLCRPRCGCSAGELVGAWAAARALRAVRDQGSGRTRPGPGVNPNFQSERAGGESQPLVRAKKRESFFRGGARPASPAARSRGMRQRPCTRPPSPSARRRARPPASRAAPPMNIVVM